MKPKPNPVKEADLGGRSIDSETFIDTNDLESTSVD